MACKYIYEGVTYNSKEEFIAKVVQPKYGTLANVDQTLKAKGVSKEDAQKLTVPQNQFLHLLGRDNNWVTFFIKSIIQDSVKKGYEKVLFPSGDTASKVEGHITLEGFKKQKEDRIDYLESSIADLQVDTAEDEGGKYYIIYDNISLRTLNGSYLTEDSAQNALDSKIKDTVTEINQLKQELERVEGPEGFGALKPIYNFYENVVSNILKKQYNINQVTDEYGNTWNEVDLSNEKVIETTSPILLSKQSSYQTVADETTIKAVTDLLNTLGIRVEVTNSILEQYGAYGVADTLNKLIQIVEGKEGVALTEEAMHLISMLLPEEVLSEMMDNIEDYQIYKDTYEYYKENPLYQKNGKPDLEKIKLEAIGKLLAEYYIGNLEKKDTNTIKTLWGKIKDWFKSLFMNNQDIFESVINKLINNELVLQDEFTKKEILLNILSQEQVVQVQKALTDPSATKQLARVDKVIERVSKVDAKIISKNLSMLEDYVDKDLRSIYKSNRDKVIDATDPLERIKNLTEHLNTELALSRVVSFTFKELQKEQRETSLTPEQSRINFSHITQLKNIALMLNAEARDLKGAIFTLEGSTTDKALIVLGKILAGIQDNTGNVITEYNQELEDTFAPLLNANNKLKLEQWLKQKRLERLQIEKRLNDPKLKGNPKVIAKVRLELESINKTIEEGLATGEKVFEMIKNKESGLNPFSDLIMTFFDSDLNSQKQDISILSNFMHDIFMEAQRNSQSDIVDIQNLFSKYGIDPTNINEAFSKYIEYVEVTEVNPATGELLEPVEDIVLISRDSQWKFNNDLNKLKAERNAILLQVNGDKEDPLFIAKQEELSNFYKDFSEEQNTGDYTTIQNILNEAVDPITGAPIDIKAIRKELLDKIKTETSKITPGEDIEAIMEEVEKLWKDYYRLESTYYDNGNKKTGRDLVIAETIKKWKQAKKDWSEANGEPFEEWVLKDAAKAKWITEKQKIDDAHKIAVDNFLQNQTNQTYKDAFIKANNEKKRWYKLNVIEKVPEQAYKDRERITKSIDDLSRMFDTGLEKSLSLLWAEMFDLAKGYRDSDNVLIGSEMIPLADAIKAKEEEIENLKAEIKKSKTIPKEIKDDISALWDELSEIQTVSTNKYWDNTFKAKISNFIAQGQTPEQAEESVLNSKWFLDNTIDVSEKYQKVRLEEYPDTVFFHNNKSYQVTYQWRQTTFNDKYKKIEEASSLWKSYKLNDKLKNPDYLTLNGEIAVKKNSGRYYNPKYDKLTSTEKAFLEEYKQLYNKQQQKFGKSLRLGDAIPSQLAQGLERTQQRIANRKNVKWSSLFKGSTYSDLIGMNQSQQEQSFGEGKSDDLRSDLVSPENRVSVFAKMASRGTPSHKRSINLYSLLVEYTGEAHRYEKMWEIKPLLEHALEKTQNVNKKKQLTFSIHKFVNKSVNLDKNPISKMANNFVSFNQRQLAFVRLGLPYPTAIAKNQLSGLYQMLLSKPMFKSYTEGDFNKAYLRAINRAHEAYWGTITKDISKYVAIVRYFEAVPNFNISDAKKQFGSSTLKAADNFKSILGYFRGTGETQMALTLWEMLQQDFNIGNKSIEDSFDYIDGKLIVTNPDLTEAVKNNITNTIATMNTYTQGNFYSSHASIIKAHWWGKMITFMSNWFYPAFVKRVGKNRILPTGQEIEGAYPVLWNVLKQSPLLLKSNLLTNKEKQALTVFKYDFLISNLIGLAMYTLNLYLSNDGDDEEEEQGDLDMLNYSALLLKKTYSEISFFNPLEKIGTPIKQGLYGSSKSFTDRNKAMNLMKYFLVTPFENTVLSAGAPVDLRKLYFGHGENDLKQPFYKNYQEDILTLNLIKAINFMPEPLYPKSALSGYNYYVPSVYDKIKDQEDDED